MNWGVEGEKCSKGGILGEKFGFIDQKVVIESVIRSLLTLPSILITINVRNPSKLSLNHERKRNKTWFTCLGWQRVAITSTFHSDKTRVHAIHIIITPRQGGESVLIFTATQEFPRHLFWSEEPFSQFTTWTWAAQCKITVITPQMLLHHHPPVGDADDGSG